MATPGHILSETVDQDRSVSHAKYEFVIYMTLLLQAEQVQSTPNSSTYSLI